MSFSLLERSFLNDFYSEHEAPDSDSREGSRSDAACIHVTLLAGWMLTGGATRLKEECASTFTKS